MAPHHLGLSPIEIDYLDVLFGFDLSFGGNHDEIIAESLFPESPLTCLLDEEGAQGGRLPADGDGRAERRLPAAGADRRRHPHQQLPGPHRRLQRRRDQRLPDRPPVLGRPPQGADGRDARRRWPSRPRRCANSTSSRGCCGRSRPPSRRGRRGGDGSCKAHGACGTCEGRATLETPRRIRSRSPFAFEPVRITPDHPAPLCTLLHSRRRKPPVQWSSGQDLEVPTAFPANPSCLLFSPTRPLRQLASARKVLECGAWTASGRTIV